MLRARRLPAFYDRRSRRHTRQGGLMKNGIIALAAASIFATGSAFAFHCPADMAKIDAALAKNPQLSAAQLDEVKKQRADGEALHKAGKHQESIDTLSKAMKTLNVQ
jgi:hypothetical protein